MRSHTGKQKLKLQHLYKIHNKRKYNLTMRDFILTTVNGSCCC